LKRLSLIAGIILGVSINLTNFLQRANGVTASRASNNALLLSEIIQNYVLVISICILLILVIAALIQDKYISSTFVGISLVLFFGALYVGPPSGHMIFQSRYILAVFLSACCALLALPGGRRFYDKFEIQGNDKLIIVGSIMAVVMQVQILIPFNEFLKIMDREANSCKGVKEFKMITFSSKADLYVWNYTNPVLSRLFWRDSDGCLIQNPDPNLWQPFTPGETDPFQRQLYWE
jgi:hypothetical protein